MKTLSFIYLIVVSTPTFANECTVSVYNFDASQKKIESILESKGYVIGQSNPKFHIESANYTGPHGEETKIINVFERGNSDRIHYIQKNISWAAALTGGFARIEKRFVKSLPDCNSSER